MTTDERSSVSVKYRKLRITWSVGWGIAAVLLLALWVRSYWRWESIWAFDPRVPYVAAGSRYGTISFTHHTYIPSPSPRWNWSTVSVKEPPAYSTILGFRFTRSVGSRTFGNTFVQTHLNIPYWFLTAFSATLGLYPLHRWRFSLRTLLIATTVVAVVLGLVMYAGQQ